MIVVCGAGGASKARNREGAHEGKLVARGEKKRKGEEGASRWNKLRGRIGPRPLLRRKER